MHEEGAIFINGPRELAEFLTSPDFNPEDLGKVRCGPGFDLDFRVSGETWQGRLDARAGLFIFQLQRDIFSLYKRVTGETLDFRSRHQSIENLLIEADLQHGSSWFKVFLQHVATELVNRMSGKQLTALGVLLILGWFGKDFFVSYNDRLVSTAFVERLTESNLALIESNSKNSADALEATRETTRLLAETTASFRDFLKYANDQEDQVTFKTWDKSETVSVHTIKSRLPEPVPAEQKIRVIRGWADFSITRQNNVARTFYITTIGMPSLKKTEISLGGGQAASEEFFKNIAQQLSEGKIPSLRLEVLLRVGENNNIESATIVSQLPISDNAPEGLAPLQDTFADIENVQQKEDRLF